MGYLQVLLFVSVSFGFDLNATIEFANNQWNCTGKNMSKTFNLKDPSCTKFVQFGASQSNYQCAEFVSRSLAAGFRFLTI